MFFHFENVPPDLSRWLLMWIKRKAQGLYLLPVPQLEAFALPGFVERTTQRPRANMHHNPTRCSRIHAGLTNIHIHKGVRRCPFLTNPESCEVSNCQERALSNAFQYLSASRPVPISGLCGRYASAKIIKISLPQYEKLL